MREKPTAQPLGKAGNVIVTDRGAAPSHKTPSRFGNLPLLGCLARSIAFCCLLSPGVSAHADDSPPAEEELRAAVAKALPLLEKGAVGHREQRTCFACHNQALSMLAMTTARSRGMAVNEEELGRQTKFIADFLGRNREMFLKGQGTGGQADTAGYALFALELGGYAPDEVTAAVAEYLLLYQKDDSHWTTGSQRPPSEASLLTTNYLAVRGLRKYGTAEQQPRIAARLEQVRGWLQAAPTADTEDRVFRLRALSAVEAPAEQIAAAAKSLLDTQRPDGGWSQLDGKESDAYATGSALVALHEAGGLPATDSAYARGLRLLLRTQQADGSWRVVSRSKPFQEYYESGFPHGKDQFISMAASGWSATALALACKAP